MSLLPVHTPAHTTLYLMDTFSPGVKQQRRETDHQPSSSVDV